MVAFYDPDGTRLTTEEGIALLASRDPRLGLALTSIATDRDPIAVVISTIFLVLDHQPGAGSPKLWETMTFGGPLDGEQHRCATREEAELAHASAVTLCRAALDLQGATVIKEEVTKIGANGQWETTSS